MRARIGQQRVAEITRLHDHQNLTFREISDRLGLSLSTIHDYYYDPAGTRADARKAKVAGKCVDCGIAVMNSGSKPLERCLACANAQSRTMPKRRQQAAIERVQRWSDADILAAIRRCSDECGGQVTTTGYAQWYEKTPRGTAPSLPTITKRFDLWATAVAAAGLTVSRTTSGPYSTRITREGCLLALEDCAYELGELPSYSMYEAWAARTGAPSAALVRIRWGSWMAAVESLLTTQPELAAA